MWDEGWDQLKLVTSIAKSADWHIGLTAEVNLPAFQYLTRHENFFHSSSPCAGHVLVCLVGALRRKVERCLAVNLCGKMPLEKAWTIVLLRVSKCFLMQSAD